MGLIVMNKPQKVKHLEHTHALVLSFRAVAREKGPSVYMRGQGCMEWAGIRIRILIHATVKASAGQGLSLERKRKDMRDAADEVLSRSVVT